MIDGYTRESGVRELRRTIQKVFRKVARFIAEDKEHPKSIDREKTIELLGPIKYLQEQRPKIDQIGVSMGLAWTPVGGELLPVEVSVTKGKGSILLTGQLGDVMRESAMAALTYVLSQAKELGIADDFYERASVHVHVPHGAIPKDGPSAGIAISTALISVTSIRSRSAAGIESVTFAVAINITPERSNGTLR